MSASIVFGIFLIFTGAALLSTVALYTRQSLLVAYILIGCILGPSGLALIPNVAMTKNAGDVGILFLLFLLGLELQPQKFIHALRQTAPVTLLSSLIFLLIGYGVCILFQFDQMDSLIVGVSMMFSSTIIALKLMPTSVLQHRHTGELMISILLTQDLMAIMVLVLLSGVGEHGVSWIDFVEVGVSLPIILGVAFVFEYCLLRPCLKRFGKTHEYIFLLAIGWCLGIAELAHWMDLSEEIGAFIAGVALAASPMSSYLVESLKPLRDFFLVMFFFSVGAGFNFHYLDDLALPALLLSALILLVKPFLFGKLLRKMHESTSAAFEIGVRLGQGSEFSLLLAGLAVQASLISLKTSYLIQTFTILTFIASSYWVVLRYPTPMAYNEKMHKE